MDWQFYRTFIGIPVKVGEGFLKATMELKGTLSGERISWVDPDLYHITLRFIGETEVSAIEEIGNALGKGIEVPRKLHSNFTRPGSFGPRKRPRVIWIGFEPSSLIEALKRNVDMVLEPCGIRPADQPFRAHLTLGRVRSIRDLNGFYDAIEAMHDRFSEQVILQKLVFYRSDLGKQGPVYTPLYQMEFPDW